MKKIIILCLVGLLVSSGYCQWGKQLPGNKALLGGAIRTGLKVSNIKVQVPPVIVHRPQPPIRLDTFKIGRYRPILSSSLDRILARTLYENAKSSYAKGDSVLGIQYLRMAARKKYAPAQYDYGRRLVMGEGVEMDIKQGWQLIQKAAEQKNAIAMFELGREFYYNNYPECLPRDTIQGLAWMKKAADADTCIFCAQLLAGEFCCNQGDTAHAIKYYSKADEYAQKNLQIIDYYYKDWKPNLVNADFLLGYCHYYGKYTSQNVDTAIKYWCHAAHLGEGEAAYYVGIRLLNGTEVSQNICQGIKYIQMTEKLGYTTEELPNYQAYIGDCYMNGVGVERDSLKAVEWYKKAGEAGHAGAQYCLSCNYFNANDNDSTIYWGEKPGCRDSSFVQYCIGWAYYYEDNTEEAKKWWKKATEQNQVDACYNLYVVEWENDSVAAFPYLQKAAELGHPEAICDMGIEYFYGGFVEKNPEKALELLTQAAELGSANAYNNLGVIYYRKEYKRKDRKLAVEYWRRGAELDSELIGTADCQCYYGYCLKKGQGVKKDKEAAIYWLKLAAKNGSEEAKEELQKMHISLEIEPEPMKIVEEKSQPTM